MLTMGIAARVVTDWLGDPGAVIDYSVRFTRPVVVPDPEGTTVEFSARVTSKAGRPGRVRSDRHVRWPDRLARARITARVRSAS